MKKVTIIGKFETANGISDGQAVKTYIVANELERVYGKDNVTKVNTFGWKKKPFGLLRKSVSAVRNSENVIFMTDEGGIKIFPWLLSLANVFTKRSIHYVVVGGWLIHFVPKHALLRWFLKRLDGVFVETTVMQKSLEDSGFRNVYLLPNCKDLIPLCDAQLPSNHGELYRFCTFSRVMKEKGIEDAVNAVRNINAQYGRTICTLDIYGPVDPMQTEWFENLKQSFSDSISYKGIVSYDKSVDVLKDYYALLFPTLFYTEGIPGTIIDAYAAGVPVVASEWESFNDVIDQNHTGWGYSFGKQECLKDILTMLIEHPERICEAKPKCLAKARQYLPDSVIDILLSKLS